MTWAEGSSADRVLITMSARVRSSSGNYISFGLSDDRKMVSASAFLGSACFVIGYNVLIDGQLGFGSAKEGARSGVGGWGWGVEEGRGGLTF